MKPNKRERAARQFRTKGRRREQTKRGKEGKREGKNNAIERGEKDKGNKETTLKERRNTQKKT